MRTIKGSVYRTKRRKQIPAEERRLVVCSISKIVRSDPNADGTGKLYISAKIWLFWIALLSI
jgi:hypothetical protein